MFVSHTQPAPVVPMIRPAAAHADTLGGGAERARAARRRRWRLLTQTPVVLRPMSADALHGDRPLDTLYHVEDVAQAEGTLFVAYTALDWERGVLSLARLIDGCLDVRQTLIHPNRDASVAPTLVVRFFEGVTRVVGATQADPSVLCAWLARCGYGPQAAALQGRVHAALAKTPRDVRLLEDDLLGLRRTDPLTPEAAARLMRQIERDGDPEANRRLLDQCRLEVLSALAIFTEERLRVTLAAAA